VKKPAANTRRASPGAKRPWRLVVLSLVALVALAAGLFALRESAAHTSGLAASLAQRGVVVVLPGSPWLTRQVEGTRFVVPSDAVRAALEADASDGRADALLSALDEMHAWGLLVATRGPTEEHTALARLATYKRTAPLRALYLSPTEALYTRDADSADAVPEGALLASVARGILDGRSPPPVGLFPEPLRRMRSVEVMVMIRAQGTPRLWRSARGSSIARALITACMVARERWHERAQALGGPLDRQLSRLDVEVALLHEDGTLSEASADFIQRVFTPVHGVAYERTRSWRYYLPDATREHGQGSAVAAYEALLRENGQEPAVLGEAQMRLYRLVVTSLGRSPASTADAGGLLDQVDIFDPPPTDPAAPNAEAPGAEDTADPAPPAEDDVERGVAADQADVDALLPPGDWLPGLVDVPAPSEESPDAPP
jgi:Arc/MetJ-type ribon-helix-helix transcriptional regulator